jgi:hypothetical protein
MTVEPFTKNGGLVIFVTVGDRHQPRVRGESVVFGGGLHDPLLNSLSNTLPRDGRSTARFAVPGNRLSGLCRLSPA